MCWTLALAILAQGCGEPSPRRVASPPPRAIAARAAQASVTPPPAAPIPDPAVVARPTATSSSPTSMGAAPTGNATTATRQQSVQRSTLSDADLQTLEILRALRDSWTTKGPRIARDATNQATVSTK